MTISTKEQKFNVFTTQQLVGPRGQAVDPGYSENKTSHPVDSTKSSTIRVKNLLIWSQISDIIRRPQALLIRLGKLTKERREVRNQGFVTNKIL